MIYGSRSRPGVLSTVIAGGLFAAVAFGAGYFGSYYINAALFAGLLKYAIGVVGVLWLFSLSVYNKLSDSTDMAGLDYRQHRNLEIEIRAHLSHFWMRALFLAVVALLLAAPTILTDAKLPIPAWVFGTACGALLIALFSLCGLWSELEEIRELKSRIKEIERRETERASQVKTLKDGAKDAWAPDEKLEGFRSAAPPASKLG